jgi:hypothetical protein
MFAQYGNKCLLKRAECRAKRRISVAGGNSTLGCGGRAAACPPGQRAEGAACLPCLCSALGSLGQDCRPGSGQCACR